MEQRKYLADFSLALVNRTGAYYISRDIIGSLSQYFDRVRYWRLHFSHPPAGLVRKILAKLMLQEISWLGSAEWVQPNADARLPTVFFDPLYVLRADLGRDDIVLCHDVGPVSHPDLFDTDTVRTYKAAYSRLQSAAPGVVFVSQASRLEFAKYFGSDFRFLHAIPLYARPVLHQGPQAPVEGVARPFLLTVAALERRKNYTRVIEAYARAGLHDKGIAYVFCGPRANASAEILAAAGRTPGVVRLPYVPDAQLRWLYANASGFVLPSLLEGFGVPALEAAGAGLVPLVSRGGAQEEAIGGNGILVDPLSVDSIAAGLTALIAMNEAERSAMVARAKAHAEAMTRDLFLQRWDAVLRDNA
nr:glycosyltransferase family 1 protein [uncultured Rhodopila sp.]